MLPPKKHFEAPPKPTEKYDHTLCAAKRCLNHALEGRR